MSFLPKNRTGWLRAGFVAMVFASLLLYQLVNRRSMQIEAEACDFGHPVPGLVPDRLTVGVYAPILLAAFLLPMPFATLVIGLVLVSMAGMAFYLADPASFFRECYSSGGESNDVTGVLGQVLILIMLSFLCCVSLAGYAAAGLWRCALWASDRVRNG